MGRILDRVKTSSGTTGKHFIWSLLTLAPYVFATVLPYAPYYEAGQYWIALGLWQLGCFTFNALGYSLSSHYWIVQLLGLEWNLRNWKLTVLPAVMSACFVITAQVSYGATGQWPHWPCYPSIAGGVLYNVVQPFFCYLALPEEMKKEKGFLMNKYIWACAPAAAIDIFWFATLAYYYSMTQVPEFYQIFVVITFRLFANFYTGMVINIIHQATKRIGSDNDYHLLGACAKFQIDAAYEVHVCFTLTDVESWVTILLQILLDWVCLSTELIHSEDSTLEAFLHMLHIKRRPDPEKEHGKKDKDLSTSKELDVVRSVRVEEGVEPGTKLAPKGKTKTKSFAKSLASLEGKGVRPTRVFHYLMEIHARLYATVIVSILMPTWYYGPNKAWYWTFPEYVLENAIEMMFLQTAAVMVHYIVAAVILKKKYDIDMGLVYMDILRDGFVSFAIGYALAPVFPTSQLGKEWSTIYYFNSLSAGGQSASWN